MKKNIPLIIGLAIPVVMIIVITILIYVPSFLAHPQYNFLYTIGDTYYNNYGDHYSVVDNHLVKTTIPTPTDPKDPNYYRPTPAEQVHLYMYDAKADSYREISYQTAQQYTIDSNIKSPDGYILDHDYSNAGIFDIFGSSRDYNAYFLKKGALTKKVYLTNQTDYYGRNVQFLGWIYQ